MQAVPAATHDFLKDRWHLIVLLNQLEHHRAGEADRDRSVELGRTATILLPRRHEVREQQPRAYAQSRRVLLDRRVDVLHDVRDLEDRTQGLSECKLHIASRWIERSLGRVRVYSAYGGAGLIKPGSSNSR